MVAFYNATGGENWQDNANWLTSEPLKRWHGVTIDRRSGRVERLDLGENQLTGEIPPELGDLEHLQTLRLNKNDLSGEIPAELGGLGSLRASTLTKTG